MLDVWIVIIVSVIRWLYNEEISSQYSV